MTSEELHECFEAHNGDFLKFEKIPKADKRHVCPDLCAWLYLCEKLGPPLSQNGAVSDVVDGAEHDEIMLAWVGKDLDHLTSDDVLYIHRCGVRHSAEYDALCMFV